MLTTLGIRFGMLDNAEHSLRRGYELLDRGIRQDDPYLVKEAIIWVHHGIELSLKQLLVQMNEYLVLSNIDQGVDQMVRLRRKSSMAEATVLDLLEHKERAHTVGYWKLVNRVTVMLQISELAPNAQLRESVDTLTNLRNRIVHSPAELNIREVATLLIDLATPFLDVMSRELKDTSFTTDFRILIRRQIDSASRALEEYQPRQSEIEHRVLALVPRFRGQQIPGDLLGQQGLLELPDFTAAEISRELGSATYLVKGDGGEWLISIIDGYGNKERMSYIIQRATRYENAELWVVAMSGTHPYVYPDILVSTEADIEQLEEVL